MQRIRETETERSRGKTAVRTYRDLNVYDQSFELAMEIHKLTNGFPVEERYSLTDQMRRAAVSLTSNIAESFSRRSSKEKSRFYDIAQASLIELQNQLIISKDVNYLSNNDFEPINEQLVICNKLLAGLLRATKDKKFEN